MLSLQNRGMYDWKMIRLFFDPRLKLVKTFEHLAQKWVFLWVGSAMKVARNCNDTQVTAGTYCTRELCSKHNMDYIENIKKFIWFILILCSFFIPPENIRNLQGTFVGNGLKRCISVMGEFSLAWLVYI